MTATLEELRAQAVTCTACDLYRDATQTVFGAGPEHAKVILLGEQPGDREDIEGLPFVGPAGQLLDRGLQQAGIPRDEVYVTNVVKHFKFVRRGKRRIHKTPNREEIQACSRWLNGELQAIQPEVVVALGATAAKALLGSSFRVSRQRGEVHTLLDGLRVVATVHPSAVLRAPDNEREAAMADFFDDLRIVARVMNE